MNHSNIYKYGTLIALLLSEAWFLWNPEGWIFEWEPLILFICTFTTYMIIEVKSKKKPENTFHPNDVQLFKEFQTFFSDNDALIFLKEHHFGDSFDMDDVRLFYSFISEWDNAGHEFIDKELNGPLAKMKEKAMIFTRFINKNTSGDGTGRQSVFPSNRIYNEEQEQRYEQEMKEINDAANELYDSYQNVVRLSRTKLHLS